MHDPSFGVAPQLLPHLHLISDFRFPAHHNLTAEMVLDMLLQATKIVREVSAVSWQYIAQPPADGTLFLAWQPLAQRNVAFASDGYSWADQETVHRQEVKGYTIEIFLHRSGWILGQESSTAHTRQRYRIINKHPSVEGVVDPSLWLVHYGAVDPSHQIPVANLPNNPLIMTQQRERHQLERQGQLQRRQFMLHDRQSWPQISLGPQGIQTQQMNPMAGHQQQQQFLRQQAAIVGQPPAKRMRHTGPGQVPMGDPRMQAGGVESIWDEEEAVQHGDAMDFLTPREISVLRYQQHHEWMEEIFSSPYPASRIAPVDLGLGLSGELAEITQGLLTPPDDSFSMDAQGNKVVVEAGTNSGYKKIEARQTEQFEKRLNAYVQKGQEDLEAMRAAHARTLEQLRKGKTYLKAERQLKEARNASHDDEDDPDFDPLDGVVKGVENSLGVVIGPRKDVVCVSKGGLVDESPKPSLQQQQQQVNGSLAGVNGGGSANGGGVDDSSMAGDDTAAGLLDHFGNNGGSNSFSNTPGASSLPHMSQPASQAQSATATPGLGGGGGNDAGEAADFQPGGGSDAQDGLDLIEGMDLDLPDIPEQDESGGGGARAAVDWDVGGPSHHHQAATQGLASAQQQALKPSDSTAAAAAPAAATTATNTTAAAAAAAATQPATSASPAMFDAAAPDVDHDDFAEFTNLDSAGDALADFGAAVAADDGGAAGDALDALDFAGAMDDAGLGLDGAGDVDAATAAAMGHGHGHGMVGGGGSGGG